jgi:hypothetical protein
VLHSISSRVFHKLVFCDFKTYILRAFECQDNILHCWLQSYFPLDKLPLIVQVGLTSSQISYLKSHFIPEIQEVMTASLLVHWLTVTFAEVPPPEDFSSQLSSLRLGKYCVNVVFDCWVFYLYR